MLVSGRAEPSPTLDVDEKAQDARCARDHQVRDHRVRLGEVQHVTDDPARPIDNAKPTPNATTPRPGDEGATRSDSSQLLVPQYVAPPGDHPPTLLVDSIPETTTPRPEPGRVESRLGQAFSAACHRGI
jgi:hypothetical protein